MKAATQEHLFAQIHPPVDTTPDDLHYFPTPPWLCEAIIERVAPTTNDVVCEPACGDGNILALIEPEIPAFGIEIDPARATLARERTGRVVVTGDFRTADFPQQPTVAIANPPFHADLIRALLDRLHRELPDGGRAAFLMPAHFLSFASTVDALRTRWSIDYVAAPRDGFARISFALCFATFTKGSSGRLTGFAFVDDALDARLRLGRRFRQILENHRGPGSPWDAAIEEALRMLGGAARPITVCRILERAGHPMTLSRQGKIRQRLQQCKRFVRRDDERWAIAG